MTIDLTRRTLLHLAGACTLSAAATAAAPSLDLIGSYDGEAAGNSSVRPGQLACRARSDR